MKREEKNLQTRRRILDNALAEFSAKGYRGSSVNNICAGPGLSKGIIYHYFQSKDALYLACMEECFQALTQYLRSSFQPSEAAPAVQLDQYFSLRAAFFREKPACQSLFCEALLSPPPHLVSAIQARREPFDDLSRELLSRILSPLPLRSQLSLPQVLETFQIFQNFLNTAYPAPSLSPQEFACREERCRRALDILLYGVVAREGEDCV